MYSKRLEQLTPYVPGEQPRNRKYIKLNTNENPYPPSPGIGEYMKNLDPEILKLYPDPSSTVLRNAVSRYYGIDPSMVFAGNGSDEILSFCFYAFFDSDMGPLLFPEFSYSFYPVYCSFYNIEYMKIPLNPDFSIRIDSYTKQRNYCGIIIPNPNAPTGIGLGLDDIRELLNDAGPDRAVIIDEAYIDFGGESAVSLISDYDNLLIVQTLSKSRSLAGLRVGFAIGNEKLISGLNTAKDSFNSYPLDRISQETAALAMEDSKTFTDNVSRIIKTRTDISEALIKKGWYVLPSSSNFIFIRKTGVSGKDVYEKLKERGILVRYFNQDGISDFVRVTIGLPEEMDILLKNISDLF